MNDTKTRCRFYKKYNTALQNAVESWELLKKCVQGQWARNSMDKVHQKYKENFELNKNFKLLLTFDPEITLDLV